MEEDNQDDSSVFISHNRSRNFSKAEVEALVELVKKHKDIILKKCTNTAANHAKDQAWATISTEINKRGFKYKRTPDNLKTKWLNLKKLAKKVAENIIDVESTNLNGVLTQIQSNFRDMEEDNQDDSSVFISHNRSRNFSKAEVEALVELVTVHKDIILNKCTNTAANHAKDQAWATICTEINKRGFKYKRTPDNLKTKWLNLKRLAKKVAENIIDVESTNLNGVLTQIVMMINENDSNVSLASVPMDGNENSTSASMTEVPQEDSFQATNDMEEENVSNMSNHSDDNANNQSDESEEAEIIVPKKRGRVRTLNFSPAECSLLIRCVRDERDNILFRGKGCSMKAVQIQNRAWARITKRYNKLSPQQRTNKMLRTKFYNMKRLANRVQFRNFFFKNHDDRSFGRKNHQEDGVNEKFGANSVKIKREFKTEPMPDIGTDRDSDEDNEEFPEVPVEPPEKHDDSSDPLCMVLNGDSGMESISHFGSYAPHENKDVVKLKLKLLKYQLETAKLERQRIKEALEAQNSELQSKAIETSFRLRTARLDALASESKLPSSHPALQYTEQEKLAQQYMLQFEHT